MPASYVHEQVALAAAEKAGVAYHKGALLAGAQGPDPFFFYHILSPNGLSHYHPLGNTLHLTRTGAFLLALVRRAREAGSLAESYALGFLTHHATDTTMHPFVFAHSYDRNGLYQTHRHGVLEAALDTWLYRKQGHKGIPRQMTGLAALTKAEKLEIAALLADTVNEVYPESPTDTAFVRRSFADCLLVTRLLYSPSGVKYQAFSTVAGWIGQPGLIEAHAVPRRLPGEDFLNLSHAPWCSPFVPETLRTDSVPDLIDAATLKAATFLQAADAPGLAEVLGNNSYDSGLPCGQAKELQSGTTRPACR